MISVIDGFNFNKSMFSGYSKSWNQASETMVGKYLLSLWKKPSDPGYGWSGANGSFVSTSKQLQL